MQSIKEKWLEFERRCIHPDAPDVQRKEMKREAALDLMINGVAALESEEAGEAALQTLLEEVEAYAADLKAGKE